MSTKQPSSPIVKLAVIGILAMGLYYGWTSLGQVQTKISEMPIEGQAAPKSTDAPAPAASGTDAARNLHPLLVESTKKAQDLKSTPQLPAGETVPLDALFERQDVKPPEAKPAAKKETEPPAPPPIDYFRYLVDVLKVQAVSPEGAVVNGRFYSIGEEIPAFAYPRQGTDKMVAPVLHAVEGNVAIIAEPGTTKRLRVPMR